MGNGFLLAGLSLDPHPQPLSQGARGVKDSLSHWERGWG